MSFQAKQGVWPVMLTPFTQEGAVDYDTLTTLIAWYEKHGVDGLFAVCQSSEMFFLSLRERIELASFVKRTAHIPVIASGHVSYDREDQAAELCAIAETGVDGVILITNRMAAEGEDSSVWLRNTAYLMDAMPRHIPLGLYECPYPYKRLLSNEEVQFCAQSGRFYFLKDTCCDLSIITQRLAIIKNSNLQLFNANTATLLDSLQKGASGFSGVMANFHPDLYVWLCRFWKDCPDKAEKLQSALTMCAQIEKQLYPVTAKYYLSTEGLPIETTCRSRNAVEMTSAYRSEVAQLHEVTQWMRKIILE